MISQQARDLWILLKSYPKQIEMPLAQAREADLHAEDFTSEPKASPFCPHRKLRGFGRNLPTQRQDEAIFIFGGGFVLDTPVARRKTAGHLALAAKARVLVPNYRLETRTSLSGGVNATLHIAAGMQHVYAIWAGAFPEADAAIALFGDWVRARTANRRTTKGLKN